MNRKERRERKGLSGSVFACFLVSVPLCLGGGRFPFRLHVSRLNRKERKEHKGPEDLRVSLSLCLCISVAKIPSATLARAAAWRAALVWPWSAARRAE